MINYKPEEEISSAKEENLSVGSTSNRLTGTIQWWWRLFAFFLAFPSISILGINITFCFFFLILIFHAKERIPIITRDKTNKWFILLFLAGTISTIFHPPLDREVSIVSDIKTILQYFYWILLAMYLRSNFHLIDWWRFSRSLFWGLVALVIGRYFLPLEVDLTPFQVTFSSTRNGFIYNLLCFFPLIVWYLQYSKFARISPILLLFFVLSILFSNGRAGFVLIIIQALLMGVILYPSFDRVFKAGLISLAVIFIIWQFFSGSEITTKIARNIEKVNPRASVMISKEAGSEGDLTRDKSWLLRKLMVDKAIEIVKEYPALGLGWMHFDKYNAELKTLPNYQRLSSLDKEFLNTRSSHNSYAMYAAEGGLIGFVILLIILLIAFIPFLNKFIKNNLTNIDLPLVAMGTLVVYFYAITSITGAGTWFVIGTSLGCISYNSKSNL